MTGSAASSSRTVSIGLPGGRWTTTKLRHPASLWRFIGRVNDRLADCAPPYVVLHDVDGLASLAGRRTWGDERFYFHAKLPCARSSSSITVPVSPRCWQRKWV